MYMVFFYLCFHLLIYLFNLIYTQSNFYLFLNLLNYIFSVCFPFQMISLSFNLDSETLYPIIYT